MTVRSRRWAAVAASLACLLGTGAAGAPAAPQGTAAPGEEAPAREEPLTLEAAVAVALRDNPRVSEAAARVRAARSRVAQQRAPRLPQVGLVGSFYRQGPEIPSFRPGSAPNLPSTRWNVGLYLSQVLFDWNRRASEERAAARLAVAERELQGETANEVRLVVAASFFNVLRAEQLLVVAAERRDAAAEQLRVARARYQADVAPRFDVYRAEAELANAEQDVIAAGNDVALAAASLNVALGRPADTPVRVRHAAAPGGKPVDFPEARDAAVRRRPLLAALRAEVEAGKATLRGRRAENLPEVSVAANYDRKSIAGIQEPYFFQAGVVMAFPFLDGGLTRHRVDEARDAVAAARHRYEEARLRVELELREALLDLDEAGKRAEAAQVEVRAAREALRVAQVRYAGGVGTTVEVTDAQVALARAGQNAANARFDLETARERVRAAIGTSLEGPAAETPAGTTGGGGMK